MARLLDKLQWRPFQVYLSHYRSAEIDISSIAVAYYLILTVFPLIVIAANVFPYLNIDTTDLLKFMNEHLPKHFYAPAANVVQDIFSTASEHRDVFISHIIGGLLSLVILFLLTFALMLSTIIQSVLRVINQTYPIGSNLTQLILNSIQPLSVAVVFLGMMVLYFILPNVKIRKIRYIMPGTIFTTLVIGYLSNLFGTYVIHTLSRLIDIKLFGSIMIFIFIFMLWFIFLARILIFGAVFNATYQELKQGELHSRRGDVLTIIQSFSGDGSNSKKNKK